MAYCIMRMEKRKKSDITGLQREATRIATTYNNKVEPGMDIFNDDLIHSDEWLRDIRTKIKAVGAHERSNSVVALDTVYSASPEWFENKDSNQIETYFQSCLQFHQKRYGHIVSAIIHYDESTPHMHVLSVPITKDNRLSAREVVGNRKVMCEAQDSFYEAVGREYGLERGIHRDSDERRQHITAQEHEIQQLVQEKQVLSTDIQIMQEKLHDTQRKLKQTRSKLNIAYDQLQQTTDSLQSMKHLLTETDRIRVERAHKQAIERYEDEWER